MDSSAVADLPGTAHAAPAVRLDFAYDGTDFSGWAAQPGRRTVEAELSAAPDDPPARRRPRCG